MSPVRQRPRRGRLAQRTRSGPCPLSQRHTTRGATWLDYEPLSYGIYTTFDFANADEVTWGLAYPTEDCTSVVDAPDVWERAAGFLPTNIYGQPVFYYNL